MSFLQLFCQAGKLVKIPLWQCESKIHQYAEVV